jgi:sugar/nucleoside kinase (ribokinase family)
MLENPMVQRSRSEICIQVGTKLARQDMRQIRAVVGLDGFVDEIIEVVDKRHNAASYDRLKTITEFGNKILSAAGQSSNYELVVTQQKLGGNGPIMANALASLGLTTTYIGNLGYPDLHPVFRDMTSRATVISIAEPGHTDALEFFDGKLMLGKITPTADVHWNNIIQRVGRQRLTELVQNCDLIGMVSWTHLPYMNDIWARLLSEVIVQLPRGGHKIFFVDLADPEKRAVQDLLAGLRILQQIQEHIHVMLGLNLKEAVQVAGALGLPPYQNPENEIEAMAAAIRNKLGLGTVVVHPRAAAAAANAEGTAWFAGPFVAQPKISTGAGDHFNAGFVSGQLLGLSLAESLCMGTATSGFYVRTAISPSAAQLVEFIRDLPQPQG